MAASVNDLDYKKNYLTVTQFAKLVGMSAATLRNWGESGKFIPEIVLDSGRRMYNITQVNDFKQKFGIKSSGNSVNLESVTAGTVNVLNPGIGSTISRNSNSSFIIYTISDRDRLVESCEVVVEYLKNNGKVEFIESGSQRLKVFSDNTEVLSSSYYPGIVGIGKYIMSHQVLGILVALNSNSDGEKSLFNSVKTTAEIFGVPVVDIYDLIKEHRRTAKNV